jgi:ELWxxDGT repeat protein
MKTTLHLKILISFFAFLVSGFVFSQEVLLKDINIGTGSSNPSEFFKYNNQLLFSAQDANNNRELWKTDGTTTGTVLVKDINPGSSGSNPGGFIELNGIIYFRANDGTNGFELWKTDGTESGTQLVKDINPLSGNANISNLTVFNNELYFTANSSFNNLDELWKTNGTESGTVLVKSFRPNSVNNSFTSNLLVNASSNELFFTSNDGSGYYLWKTDGTTPGTVKLKSLYNTPQNRIGNFAIINSEVCFTAYNVSGKQSLWKSDGTTSGTSVFYNELYISNVGPGPLNSKVFNDKLYFNAQESLSSINGVELWVTDGTLSGTQMVKDIIPTNVSSFPNNFFEINNQLFFQVFKDPGTELWKTDGTEVNTVFVKDINPGVNNSLLAVYPISELNKFYFTGDDGTGRALWKSNGTSSGTIPLYDISESDLPLISEVAYLNNKLFFTKETASTGFELWSFDATLGVNDVAINKDVTIYPNPTSNILHISSKITAPLIMAIYNQLGQMVLSSKSNSATTLMDVSSLSKGLYFLNINTSEGNAQTIKFIKN